MNKLCLNVKKTNFMVFCAKNKKYSADDLCVTVDNVTVNQVFETKFLGVYIDSKLNWTTHIKHVACKISKNIGIITRARKFLNKKTLTGLYYTFIYPYLNYCCTVWGTAPETHLKKLHILQKRIIRIIAGKPRLYPSENLFKSLRILPIQSLNTFKLSVFCHKWKCNLLPNIFSSFITYEEDFHEYNTRIAHNRISHLLYLPKNRTVYADNSVRYQAPLTWNNLSPELHYKDEKSFKYDLFLIFVCKYYLVSHELKLLSLCLC